MSAYDSKGTSRLNFRGWEEILSRARFATPLFLATRQFRNVCAFVLQRNVTMAAYDAADGDGHVGNDAMTIPDYVAIGFLLMTLLAAARWFAQRKFEL